MLEQAQTKGLFTAFPDAEAEGSGPSKSQLKKMAKAQAAKDAKAKKASGGADANANDGANKNQQKKP